MATLFGLTKHSSNEEIKQLAFQKIHEIRWMPFATTAQDGLPSCRAIDFNLLSDGNLYFETEAGKSIYSDLVRCPVGTICSLIGQFDSINNIVMLRMRVLVEPVSPEEPIVAEFFARNPGTMSLFTKAPQVMKLFRIVLGQGELFQTYRDDAVDLLRFHFGDIGEEPARYVVDPDTCVGCGSCIEVCNHGAIYSGTPFHIDPLLCLKCGACRDSCPTQSILQTENDTWRELLQKLT